MREFKKLSDSEWVNVVNNPDVLACGGGHAAEEAVAKAFNLIEARLIENNQPILDELAEQHAELLAALKKCAEYLEDATGGGRDEQIDLLIAKAEARP